MFCALQAHVPRHYRKAKGAFLSTARESCSNTTCCLGAAPLARSQLDLFLVVPTKPD